MQSERNRGGATTAKGCWTVASDQRFPKAALDAPAEGPARYLPGPYAWLMRASGARSPAARATKRPTNGARAHQAERGPVHGRRESAAR